MSKKTGIFLVLISLFLFIVTSYVVLSLKNKTCEVSKLETEKAVYVDSVKFFKDSIIKLQDSIYNLSVFTLDENAPALDYLDKFYGFKDNWPGFIFNRLMSTNEQAGNNPLIPYEGIEGPFKINNVQILNHKWIIANFTDGKYWGEIFLEYEPLKNDSVHFKVIKSFIYPD